MNSLDLIKKKWTPIDWKFIEIQIGTNPTHIITRIQFLIQLVLRCKYVRRLLSLYSWFYEVTMLESTNVIDEGKMQVYFQMLNCVRRFASYAPLPN
jgi:hypothetical protein